MLGEICECVLPLGSQKHLPGSIWRVSVPGRPLSWISDRNPAPLPWSRDARNKRKPSEDDCFAGPIAAGIHLRSSGVAWRYAALVSFPGSRNQDKLHGPDGQNGGPTQRE